MFVTVCLETTVWKRVVGEWGWGCGGVERPQHFSVICWQSDLRAEKPANRFNSNERPWEPMQGQKALRTGKLYLWHVTAKKIPTAMYEQPTEPCVLHSGTFLARDRTAERKKTKWENKLCFETFFSLPVAHTTARSIHFSQKSEALNKYCKVSQEWSLLSPIKTNLRLFYNLWLKTL